MDVIVQHPAALDVHKEQVTACVRLPAPDGTRAQDVREFKTTVGGLLVLHDWLKAHGVTQVAMEATGVYWKPVWAVLEDSFDCLLVNARHVKQVPGRKTDVKDAEWLCQLLEAGLLRRSFVPPKPIRQLRNFTRYRKAQIKERQREANRLHKALEDTGIKLDCVATDILGKSGRAMLDALCEGTTDPEVLAELAKGRLRAKQFNVRLERAQLLLDRRREPLDLLVEEVQMRENRADQQRVIGIEAPLERFAQRRDLRPQPALGQLSEDLRVGRARDERVEHRAAGLAEDVGRDAVELDPGVLQALRSRLASRACSWIWVLRYRVRFRSVRIGLGDTKLRRSSPASASWHSHSASLTSVLRPGTCLTWRALTSRQSNSSSRIPHTGFQSTPVASITTCSTPNAASQSRNVNSPATVVENSATRCSRERPYPGTRTHAITCSLCTSSAAGRSTTVSICTP